ncbi:hypothetical protein LJC58_03880 [Lachnospiraceae bacterium OttesenSCG-928-D06]|nr:hypothetical protein [Lachnospiraceae bacterium OttesenSCG-928-D06]
MATKFIRNKNDLHNLNKYNFLALALQNTQKIVNRAIQKSINEYYKEYTPTEYVRTYKFLNSLVSTNIVQKGNTITCEVKIDENYLKYQYPNQFNSFLPATGSNIATWANHDDIRYHNHGGTVNVGRNTGFWEDALSNLSGREGIINILISYLKKYGFTVL